MPHCNLFWFFCPVNLLSDKTALFAYCRSLCATDSAVRYSCRQFYARACRSSVGLCRLHTRSTRKTLRLYLQSTRLPLPLAGSSLCGSTAIFRWFLPGRFPAHTRDYGLRHGLPTLIRRSFPHDGRATPGLCANLRGILPCCAFADRSVHDTGFACPALRRAMLPRVRVRGFRHATTFTSSTTHQVLLLLFCALYLLLPACYLAFWLSMGLNTLAPSLPCLPPPATCSLGVLHPHTCLSGSTSCSSTVRKLVIFRLLQNLHF